MKVRIAYFSFFLLALSFVVLTFIFSPETSGQQDQNAQCMKDCTQRQQECRRAANANRDQCKQEFEACRQRCRNANANTNGNMNGNMNGNVNTNGDANMNTNTNMDPNMNMSPTPGRTR